MFTRDLNVLVVAAAAAAAHAAPAAALELTIELSGARNSSGTVSVALYGSEEGWLKQPLAAERIAAGDRVRLVFRNLGAGSYALAAFHDENGNGKLDRNVVGMPTEAYGFSRDARGAFGPPQFDAAAIEVKADTTIKVALQ